MTTPVGLSALETAASVRAATMGLSETDFRDKRFDRVVLAEVPDGGVAALAPPLVDEPGVSSREVRMLCLAGQALRECLAPIADQGRPIGVCLALPDSETRIPLDQAAFLRRLSTQVGGVIHPRASDASHRGRAAGLVAIGQGVLTIQQGIAPFILAGGVDTYRDAYVLGTLDLEKRLKSADNYDGFIPGEGAGFVLLTSERTAIAHKLVPLARVSSVATGIEAGHLYSDAPYRGDGLAAVFAQLSGSFAQPFSEVYSSMNGESHWAKEWGVGFMRNRSAFTPEHGMHHPADCFGDTGAACGPLLTGLAAIGINNRYRRSPALVYCSSDRGSRAAIAVS